MVKSLSSISFPESPLHAASEPIVSSRQPQRDRTSWRLRYWIMAGYAVPVIALVTSAGIAIINANIASQKAKELDQSSQISERISDISVELQTMARTARGYLLSQEQISLDAFAAAQSSYAANMTELEALVTNDQQQATVDNLQGLIDTWISKSENLLDLARQGQVDQAIDLWRSFGRDSDVEMTQQINEIDSYQEAVTAQVVADQAQAIAHLRLAIVIATMISLILSTGIGLWVIQRITRQMNRMATAIASSTSEIAASIEQQDQITAQQAASINETTTTMDELGASSHQSAEQAEAAAIGAKQVLSLAEGGARTVNQSLAGMNDLQQKVDAIADQILRLSEQTSQIGSISGLVSNLANQTNMLALNAAVEAVRAGEHGKGFAVVSSEIRKLADQSKKSAEKINGLVNDIQTAINSTVMVTDEGTKTVEAGVQTAQATAEVFNQVTDAVNNVVLNSQQISLNIQQQAVAIQQVVGAMGNLNLAAQETASGITQIKQGTHLLNGTANTLQELV